MTLSAPQIPIVSNLTGDVVAERDGGYWACHVREPVRFADGIARLERLGVTRFVEVGPDAALTPMAQGSVSTELTDRGLFTAAMRKGRDQEQTVLACLAAMHTAGAAVDWDAFFAPAGAKRAPLPTYAFQRERYWLDQGAGSMDLSRAGIGAIDHPLLGAMLPLPHDGGAVFSGRVALATHPWLRDHAVAGVVLLPGTAFVELALVAADQLGASGVEELTLAAPLLLDEQEPVNLQVHVTAPDPAGRRTIEIRSCRDGDWTQHASGVLAAAGARLTEPSISASWPPVGAREVDVDRFYDNLADAGYEYGPAFQNVRRVYQSGETWFAELALSDAEHSDAVRFRLHPALADAALQVSLLAATDEQETVIPFSFAGVRARGEGAVSLRVMVEAKAADGEAVTVALAGVDAAGATAFVIDTVQARPADVGALRPRPRALADDLLAVRWAEHDADGTGDRPLGRVAIIEQDDTTLGAELSEAMGLDRHADLAALTRATSGGAPAPDVVLVPTPAAIASVLELLQAWLTAEMLADTRLVVLTDRALAVGNDEAPNLAQAAVPGLVRSAVSEHPLRFGLVDLGAGDVAVALRAALACGEPEVAVREGRVLVPRLVRAGMGGALIPPAGGWRLGVERAGSLEGLTLLPSDTSVAELGEGQVRVAVQAAGLNFRDVLVALGQYPEPSELGSEGAGVVLETAPDVSRVAVGDRVMGLMAGAFGPAVVTDAQLVAQVPDGWSWAEAAAVPTVFLTALYGLVDVAGLRRGERVLVHGGAGGVGMAAIQIARHLGSEVFATAHPEKWEVLRGLGLDDGHIASSRDLGFRDAFDRVDVVLDSLAGEFVDASLSLLGEGGRFVEIGKADVRDPNAVAAAHPGVTYRAFDLLEAGSDRLQAMLGEIIERFAVGAYRHLPISSWDVRRAPDAFRHMREARHVGKIVLTIPLRSDRAGTVLITGGTGGLGALVARHLAGAHGVRRLVLTSRRGPDAEGSAELIAELTELGCTAEAIACDVTDRAQVQALLSDLPLTGVVHAAGVLDDATITSLDADRLHAVMAPKVDGALHLHELTADRELSFFVLFSSAAAALGAPGQGNYAAANGFLDALAHHRQAHGLPAISLAWGPWESTPGMVAGADAGRLARLGAKPLPNEQALRLFDIARGAAQAHLVPIRLDRAGLRAQAAAGVLAPIASELVRASVRRSEVQASLAQMLAGASEPAWPRIALDLVCGHVAAVLGHPSPRAVDPDSTFKDMGFDSLAAVELRNRLIQATALSLPATVVFDHPTPALAAAYLLTKAAPGDARRAAVDEDADGDLAVVTEQRIAAASADEILELVNEELQKSYEGLERS